MLVPRIDGWSWKFFGRPTLTAPGGRRIALPRKAFALALHLSIDCRKQSADRATIGEFLWSQVSPDVQQANTRSFLRRIRAAQGSNGPFKVDSRVVRLSEVENDYDHLLRSIANGSPEVAARAIIASSRPLLVGAERGDATFEHWLQTKQSAVRELGVTYAKAILSKRSLTTDPSLEFALARHVLARDAEDRSAAAIILLKDLPASAVRTGSSSRRETSWEASTGSHEKERSEYVRKSNSDLPLLRVSADVDLSAQRSALTGHFMDTLFSELWLPRSLRIAVGAADQDAARPADESDAYLLTTRVSNVVTPRLIAHLTHARSGMMLWAESFQFHGESAENLARRVAIAVNDKIADHLVELSEHEQLADQPNFAVFLRGERTLQKFDLPHIRRARRLFKMTMQSDPEFARGYAGLARSLRMEWILLAGADNRLLEDAANAAEHAITLAPETAACYRDAGMVALYRRRFDMALEHLETARRLNPHDPDMTFDHCDALISVGESEAAIKLLEQAKSPLARTADAKRWIAATGYYALGRYEEALGELSKMRAPESAFRLRAACHAMAGDAASAQEFMGKFLEENPGFCMKNWLLVSPFRRKIDQMHFSEGVMMAGFP